MRHRACHVPTTLTCSKAIKAVFKHLADTDETSPDMKYETIVDLFINTFLAAATEEQPLLLVLDSVVRYRAT